MTREHALVRQTAQEYDDTPVRLYSRYRQAPDVLHNLRGRRREDAMGSTVDGLDARIVRLFADEPRVGVLEASRRLGVARGTVQARLDRLTRLGIVRGWGPEVEPGALGYPVMAFATMEIRQGAGHEAVARHLAAIPEVLEAFTITGAGDMWCRVVARSNADLQRVIDAVVAFEGIVRTSTVIALATQIPHRVLPLLAEAARPGEPTG
jgi:DNA-binding Lrp family transcriptional regulator